MKNETGPWENAIGNFFSHYFFEVGQAWNKGETYVWKEHHLSNNDLLKNLPSILPPPNGVHIPKYDSHAEAPGGSAWSVDSEEGKQFWDAMKPYIHRIIDDSLTKSELRITQRNPIIHYRCSDVPFNRHPWYHLAKYNFYKDALKGYNSVDIFSCHTHASKDNNKETCHKYVELLTKELETNGIKVNVMCGHFIEDFAKMFYAPLVISPGSSMSFMAGYFGHGKLITTGHEKEGTDAKCTICTGEYLLHSQVPDYFDVDAVHKMLKDDK